MQQFFRILFFLWRIFQRQSWLMGFLFLLSRGATFWFFRKGLFFEGARCMGMGFQRHGSEMNSEFVILLRYGMAELWELGGVVECRVQKS